MDTGSFRQCFPADLLLDGLSETAVARRGPCNLKRARAIGVYPAFPYTMTREFLLQFGLETFRNLHQVEALEDAGLLSRQGDTADMMPMAQTKEEDPGWPV